jgi:hypothetical protein
MRNSKLNYDRKSAWRIPKDLPTTRSMLKFLLKRFARDKRFNGHDEQSVLENAAQWASTRGLTVDETLYLYCR